MEGYEGFAEGMPEMSLAGDQRLKKTVRIFPHKMQGEGHFLALLQKGARTDRAKKEPHQGQGGRAGKLPPELKDFLVSVNRKMEPARMDIRGEKVYYMPEDIPPLKGIRFLRTGLFLGELKKKRVEPSQAFAMNLKKEEYKYVINLPVTDERIVKYLKGETLDVEDVTLPKEKGWYLVCVDGYPLGFGKLAGQPLKNKYLPGWRWQSL